ncbi:ABC transporter ATP-binding protein [Megalodesulfovibrio paquesii]
MARIELNTVAHSYTPHPAGPDDYALKRIHTVWDDGGAYAVLGPSGCGKTTMLNIISGLLTPSEGQIRFDGKDVTALPPEKRNIAQVFQFPVLYDTMTVEENLAFPLKNRGVPAADIARRVREVADTLDLGPYLKRRAAGLAADAKQKISLGRGLVRSDVAAILFDEPLTVIDPHLKWQLRRKLKEIHSQFHLTLIYVTHDQVEAMTFADKVVVMYDGEIVQMGTPEALFESPEHTFVGYFIGSPGMNILPCTLDHGRAVLHGGSVALDPSLADLAAATVKPGDKLELGIRPMYVEVSNLLTGDAPQDALEGTVTLVEDLGSSKIVSVQLHGEGGQAIKAKVQPGLPVAAGRCRVRFPAAHSRLFVNGRLLRAEVAA